MPNKLIFALALALLMLGSGCWETPLQGTVIASRSTPIHFTGWVPVPQGAAPTGPINIHVNGSTNPVAVVYAGAFVRSVGGYDWYRVDSMITIPSRHWERKNGQFVADIVAHTWQGNIYYYFHAFQNTRDMSCFANAVAGGSRFETAGAACNGNPTLTVYAN